ncbi:MAG TPA: DUF6056 family protein [Kofleriaceae bacterium]|nr:DUF6056 family protein [Kofleriaceae bacterium]
MCTAADATWFSPRASTVLRALFCTYVALTALHIGYVVHHEPFAFDAWNVAVDTHAQPASVRGFITYWVDQYTSSNPRIGQPLAYLAYKTTGVAELVTPLAYLALVLGGFVLALRRAPVRHDLRDLATLAIGIGCLWFAAPNFPAYLFCRAYATNYVWVAALEIWFLVALRAWSVRPSRWRIAAIAVLGVAAGMGNEHVGPTLIAFALAFALYDREKYGAHRAVLAAGVGGVIAGYALLFLAPGQGQRYDGLAAKLSLFDQVVTRGAAGNLDIVRGLLFAASPLLALIIAIAIIGLVQRTVIERHQRGALAVVGLALLAGVTIAITLFVSPLLGPRFYLHAMFVLLAAVMALARAFLTRTTPFVILAVVASGYAAARTVPLYTRLAAASDLRLAELAATEPGDTYTARAWEQVPESWWFLGDDTRDQRKRDLIASYYQLGRVVFRAGERWSPLGVTDVKLQTDYAFDPPPSRSEAQAIDAQFAAAQYLGRDVRALQHAFLDAIAEVQRDATTALRAVDLIVTFDGPPPRLPRDRVYVARWRDGALESYAAQIVRHGRSPDREVELPPALADWEPFVVALGDPPRRLRGHTYRPWRSGEYWLLACKREYCFVVAATNHSVSVPF